MQRTRKSEYLQLRISMQEKRAIQHHARQAGLNVSAWILARVLPEPRLHLEQIIAELSKVEDSSYMLAELSDLIESMNVAEFAQSCNDPLTLPASRILQNQVAAMLEVVAHRLHAKVPTWVLEIQPLKEPVFGSQMKALRLHLLTHSPAPFRRRNIFVDSIVGDRV